MPTAYAVTVGGCSRAASSGRYRSSAVRSRKSGHGSGCGEATGRQISCRYLQSRGLRNVMAHPQQQRHAQQGSLLAHLPPIGVAVGVAPAEQHPAAYSDAGCTQQQGCKDPGRCQGSKPCQLAGAAQAVHVEDGGAAPLRSRQRGGGGGGGGTGRMRAWCLGRS